MTHRVRIELFGLARRRAGLPFFELPLNGPTILLGDLIRETARRYPELAAECFDGDTLRTAYIASLDGDRFVREPSTTIASGTNVLIMAADAGGH